MTELLETFRAGSDMQLSLDTIALRLGMSILFAALIGWEREAKDKPAGLRTHMVVCLGAAAFYLISIEFMLGPLKDAEGIAPDPTRVFEGIITGIGFLGAGAIIQGNQGVTGLTTGAGVWLSGAIGLACGGGYFAIAFITALFALFVLHAVWLIKKLLPDRYSQTPNDSKGA